MVQTGRTVLGFRLRDSLKELLTPKQVARAIGVSESSLKRWCDRGLIATERTAGGHRRLRANSVVAFLREHGHQIVHPEVLGLPASTGRTEWTVDRARRGLRDALVAGNEQVCRQIVLDVYFSPHPVSVICDQVIAGAFHDIGDLWSCGDVEVYQERRACEISVRILHELRMVVENTDREAPIAIGATLDGDQYTLPVTMAELVLRDCGWNATSLGNSLPFSTLKAAVGHTRPQMLWISVSWIQDESKFVNQANDLFAVARDHGSAFAVGGQGLTESIRKQMKYTVHCDTMADLENFARTLAEAHVGAGRARRNSATEPAVPGEG